MPSCQVSIRCRQMLSSFTRSRAVAFALGAGFQALVLGITLSLFGL